MADNDERIEKLRKLLEDNHDDLQFAKLVFEWVKTGVFSQCDFERAMRLKWEQGCDFGAD